MERQTILILDSQLHRGGIIEQGLNSRGFNVFRTSRSREASKLLQVLQPEVLVVAWEGEGKDFYEQRALTGQVGWTRCVVLGAPGMGGLRAEDALVDMSLQSNLLVEYVSQEIARLSSAKPALDNASGTPAPVGRVTPVPAASGVLSPHSQAPRSAVPHTQAPRSSVPRSSVPLSSAPRTGVPGRASASFATPLPLGSTGTPLPRGSAGGSRKREWRGSLDKLDIARLFSILMRRQASGKLVLSFGEETRTIWLQSGSLLSAESNHIVTSFVDRLVQEGLVSPEQVSQLPQLSQPRPGYALHELGLISQAQVDVYNRAYTEQTVLSCFLWESGGFQFVPTGDNKASRPGGIELAPLIMQGVREGYQVDRLLFLLGGEERTPQWFAHRSPENFLPLNTLEKRLLQQIDGKRSLRRLCADYQQDARILYGLVYVLMILGFVTLQEPSAVTPTSGLQQEHDGQMRGHSGEVTPEVPMSSVSPLTSTGQVQTPRQGVPSLQPVAQIPPRSPTASYRSFAPNRPAMRPTMQRPSLDVVTGTEASSAVLSAQEQALLSQIDQKYQQVVAEDYFSILEVPHHAGDMEIRRAYQRLKQTFGTSQATVSAASLGGSKLEDIMQTIQEAYDVLGDPQLRELYRQNFDAV
jgi:hypothetical protein